jgi:elongation factor G
VSAVIGGKCPKEFIPSVDKAFKSLMDKGPLIGFPLLDFKVTLTDGGFHAVDSSQIAFEAAAAPPIRQTMPKAAPQLLEPIMKIDVFTPTRTWVTSSATSTAAAA